MALIEGVGDEVTLLFGVVFLFLVLVLAWASTHTAEPDHLVSSSSGPVSSVEPESQEPQPPGNITSPPHSSTEDDKTERAAEESGDGAEAAGEESLLGAEALRHRNVQGPSVSMQPPAGASSSIEVSTSEDVPPNNTERNMVLRLKFLNDTERTAQVNPDDTIGYIKRTYFAGQEHQVRLIYQGQLLQDDAQTLASLNLADNCVLHCHISQHATRAMPAGARAADQVHVALNVGSLMVPLFVLMLSVLWYFQFQYRQFFTAPATASLVGITIFFSFVAFGVYRR
ncbi:Transmembrane and ubiquitin-like domain-containing protein 1 [Bagarius yarrelli]|uniref:Transmembrane and ubiquitin-like domain-containing protein 1 n=1 Tax=Bagarius yarrelli TaxID=175774 RepID=A0A556TV60_BAGYA|nr:Transmembrane and ubiquitin-like domain-containing protein 1 [Bagarius yarrelli]